MEITAQLMDKLAALSGLHFDDAQKAALQTDLHRMIRFVEKLQELDTTGIEPLLQVGAAENVLRDDLPGTPFSKEQALAPAPKVHEDFFLVPKVIQK